MNRVALSLLLLGCIVPAPLIAQTSPTNPPPVESQPDPTLPAPDDEGGPMTPGEGDATPAPAPADTLPPTRPGAPPQVDQTPAPVTTARTATTPGTMPNDPPSQRTLSARNLTPVPGPTQARSGPLTPPSGTTMMNPPFCSRTVRDNCMDPRQAPRGYRPGAPMTEG